LCPQAEMNNAKLKIKSTFFMVIVFIDLYKDAQESNLP
jgi:hypothetical protein